jgi:hypothetical protein
VSSLWPIWQMESGMVPVSPDSSPVFARGCNSIQGP